MDYADAIRRQAEDAPRAALQAVTAALWGALANGQITEAEAETLSTLIEARRASERGSGGRQAAIPAGKRSTEEGAPGPARAGRVRGAVGSRPRSDASMERRRRWAASGRLPPGLAARFTLAEQAALALLAAEVARRGDCRLSIENMAAVAGVCRSTVKNAIREARQLGLLTVEERQITGFRNDTNIIRIVSPEWTAWLRLARRGRVSNVSPSLQQGGGVKTATTTPTEVITPSESRETDPLKGCRRAAGDPGRIGYVRIDATRGAA